MNEFHIYIYIYIFTRKIHGLPRYMHVVAYDMNEPHMDMWCLLVRRVNMYMYIFEG